MSIKEPSIQESSAQKPSMPPPLRVGSARLQPVDTAGGITRTAAKALSVLRLVTGFVFLWAFLDKTFGLRYSPAPSKAWINGGSPTKRFLSTVKVGPLQSPFHSIAGTWWADWLFMLGMLGIGLALLMGVAVRAAAAAGVLILALMWLAEFPLARNASGGAPTGSVNPLVDCHVVYAAALVVLAATDAGNAWGLGRRWVRVPFVRDNRWAR